MKVFVLSLLIVAVMSISALAQGKSSVEGVWQLTEITMTGKYAMTMKITQPSVYIFTKTHYSKTYIGSDKPRAVLNDYSKATQEQLLAIFVDGFDASAGTYEMKVDKLTLRPTVAKSPSDMREGTWSSYSIKIAGDAITLTPEDSNTGPNKKKVSFKLTRVE
jgi:hypothetical protein